MGRCTTCLCKFSPCRAQKSKFSNIFFVIVTTQYDHPRYVEHVLVRIYVFFTLFGYWAHGAKVPAARHTKQLQTTLRQAHVARVNRDYAQTAILNKDIEHIASNLNIPLCRPVNVTIPYMTPTQRSTIQLLANRMVRSTQKSSWERKAIRAHIRIVASTPMNVRRTFERLANKHDKATHRPTCHCNAAHLPLWRLVGPVSVIEGHYAILPVDIQHDGKSLRATDPLPCPGKCSRADAIHSLPQLARTLHIQHEYTAHTLSKALPVN